MRIRGLISILLTTVFIIMSVSGVLIHIHGHSVEHSQKIDDCGKVGADRFAEIPYEDDFALKRLHEWAGYTLIILGVVHMLLNRRPLRDYILKRW